MMRNVLLHDLYDLIDGSEEAILARAQAKVESMKRNGRFDSLSLSDQLQCSIVEDPGEASRESVREAVSAVFDC